MTELAIRIRTTWELVHFEESPSLEDCITSEQDWLIAGYLRDEQKGNYYPAMEELAVSVEEPLTEYAIELFEGDQPDYYPFQKILLSLRDSRVIRDDIEDAIYAEWKWAKRAA